MAGRRRAMRQSAGARGTPLFATRAAKDFYWPVPYTAVRGCGRERSRTARRGRPPYPLFRSSYFMEQRRAQRAAGYLVLRPVAAVSVYLLHPIITTPHSRSSRERLFWLLDLSRRHLVRFQPAQKSLT